ncbi:MAG: FHA domain-containing protein [Deltaproteobacteria bacterium]|nr:FHA domain-containing protein [Deltaproteobacteria bacterium]
MLKLFLVDGEQNRTVVPLLRSEITIGRGEGNTIRLTDQNISRVHARLVRTATGYTLEDLSRYGIEGPKGRIQGASPVASGEAYRIGDYQLEFKEERASMPLPAARPRPTIPTVAPSTSALASTESAPVAASMTPPGTGTAVFLADDIDSALSALDTKPSAASVAASPPPESGSSTAGSLAVEPEPVVAKPSSVTQAFVPPAAPSATAPSTAAIAAPSWSFEPLAAEPPRSTMTLRPTSVQAMKLVGQTAPFGGAELQLTLPRLVIGSGPSCDVVLEHPGIAPEHLALRYDGTSWWVDALSGQVRVDGDLTPTTKLWKGAVITLGGLDFRFADPLDRQSVRLAPVPAPAGAAAAAASLSPSAPRDVDGEFDEAVLNRGKRNQKIGLGVGVALALGIVGLLAAGGKDAPAPAAGSGSAETEVAMVAAAPEVAAPLGSGSGTAAAEVAVVAPAPEVDAKAAAEAQAAADEKTGAEAKAAADVKAAEEAKAAAEAKKAATAAAGRQATADRKAAADAAKEARAAKAAEAAAARAARQAPKQAAPARSAVPAPARTVAAAPAKATPPAPFQEVVPAAPATPAAPTAASLISDAKRAAVQNNRKEAVKFLEQARRLDPKNAEVNQLLFSNYRALGNTLRASEAVKRYLALKPNDSQRADYEKWLEQNAPR